MMQPDKKPLAGSVSDINESAARVSVARIARMLAASFPAIRAAIKSEGELTAWVDVWLTQIRLVSLTRSEVEHGLANLHHAPPDEPFGWPTFVRLCRPSGDLRARAELATARTAYAGREFSRLDPATWQAAHVIGWEKVWNDVTDVAWAQELAHARAVPDMAFRELQPRLEQAQIEVSPAAKATALERHLAKVDLGCASMHDVLAGRIPTLAEPQHSAEYLAIKSRLGILPR